MKQGKRMFTIKTLNKNVAQFLSERINGSFKWDSFRENALEFGSEQAALRYAKRLPEGEYTIVKDAEIVRSYNPIQ